MTATAAPDATRRLHAKLGRAWQQAPETDAGRSFAIARHFRLAGDEVPAAERVQAGLTAAREARRAFDMAEAHSLGTAAAELAHETRRELSAEDEQFLGEGRAVGQ